MAKIIYVLCLEGILLLVGFVTDAEWVKEHALWIGAFFLLVIVATFVWEKRNKLQITDWLSRHVWWRFGRMQPQGASVSNVSVTPLLRSSFTPNQEDEFPYPYPKTVLKLRIENPKGTRNGDSSGKPFSMSLAAQLENDHTNTLKNCSVILRSISGISDAASLANLPFKLPKDGTVQKTATLVTQFTLARRNMSDTITPEPFLLMVGGRSVPMEENKTYMLELELRSEYKHSTLASVQLDTGTGLSAEARVINQKVLENAND